MGNAVSTWMGAFNPFVQQSQQKYTTGDERAPHAIFELLHHFTSHARVQCGSFHIP
jgi:hypothetical protein